MNIFKYRTVTLVGFRICDGIAIRSLTIMMRALITEAGRTTWERAITILAADLVGLAIRVREACISLIGAFGLLWVIA